MRQVFSLQRWVGAQRLRYEPSQYIMVSVLAHPSHFSSRCPSRHDAERFVVFSQWLGMPHPCHKKIESHPLHPQAVFEGLLHEALLHDGSKHASISAASAAQLRYLVLKNLASLLAAEDASAPRALSLYAQALMLDDGDSVVWNHMGTLVRAAFIASVHPTLSMLSTSGGVLWGLVIRCLYLTCQREPAPTHRLCSCFSTACTHCNTLLTRPCMHQ